MFLAVSQAVVLHVLVFPPFWLTQGFVQGNPFLRAFA